MTEVVEISVLPELLHYQTVVTHVQTMLIETRLFPGCLNATLTRDIGSYRLFIRHEWDSPEALDHYLTTRIERGDFDVFADWLAEEQTFKTYSVD